MTASGMRKRAKCGALLIGMGVAGAALGAGQDTPLATSAPVSNSPLVYGAWHCGNDACIWGTVRDLADFDQKNHWLIDRGDGKPSVNLVVLSFVHPLKLLNSANDATTANGIPKGFTTGLVNYFTKHDIRVMLSIGGITYVDAWNQALAQSASALGARAAAVAGALGVGIEIDYEENTNPNLAGLQAFIDAYRNVHPYDQTGANPAARLTIDTGAGDRWLIALNRKATADWLSPASRVLDYANAMVPARQPNGAADAQANWQEHVDGKPQYAPPVPPLAPARFTGGLYIAEGSKVRPECNDFSRSLQRSTGTFVQTVAPKVGTTPGMLGYMFWAAEKPSSRGVTTTRPNTCERGVGAGSTAYAIPIPMPPLRQD